MELENSFILQTLTWLLMPSAVLGTGDTVSGDPNKVPVLSEFLFCARK